MIVNGYAVERIADGAELFRYRYKPERFDLPNDVVIMGAEPGWQNDEYRLVDKAWEEPDPEPIRRMIDKAIIIDRLTDAQLDQALSLMTTRQKERWRMPGHPAVYVDDPEVLGLLQAIGADPAVVLA